MSVEAYTKFLAATGHRVVRTASADWFDASRWFFLSIPSHRLLAPDEAEIRAVLRHQPCLGVRFPGPVDGAGKLSFQIVCDRRGYGLEQLSANVRSKVRRGLRRCEVGPLPFGQVAAEGARADRDTLARQGRSVRLAGARWDRHWAAAATTPGMEAWAARVSGQLAAFLVTVEFGDCVEFLMARSRDDFLDAYPNNALLFHVTEEMLVRRGVRKVTFGLESLEPVGPLDEFKFGMGFRPEAIRQRVVFHPMVRALLRRPALRAALYRHAERSRTAVFWRKAAGLLRFAEAGGL